MKIVDMLNDKATAALGGVAAGVPALLAEGCATRPCTACFACAASLAALGGIWLKGRLKGDALAKRRHSDESRNPVLSDVSTNHGFRLSPE
ncbi:MAG: hypothetical protein OEV28_07910 [Nitrospirota bacterium]|nr:hypothetical protein [Nitrospirota bacterium]